jgi:multiple sugar transport system permease protein
MKRSLRILAALFFVVPWVWTVLTALKTEQSLQLNPEQFFPDGWPWQWQWSNLAACLEVVPMHLYSWNTAQLALLCTIGHIISCPLAAFALLNLRPKWQRVVWTLTLAAYVVPYPVVMLGQYLVFQKLGWINSWLPVVVPCWLGNPFFILYLYQVFRRFPKELIESSRLEGASSWQILFQIILPNSTSAMVTVAILTVQSVWNDFLAPLLYLQDQSHYTVNLGLQFYRSAYQVSWSLMMSASLISVAPMILLFLLAQPYFIRDSLEGSEK